MTPVERACLLALVVPFAIVTAATAWVAVGERTGFTPMAAPALANSAEAAAVGSAGDVFRFLRSGEDPRKVYAVRPEIISSAILKVTTLEAAMWSRELEMIELLDREGAIAPGDRTGLACLAADLDLDEIREYLAPGGTGCEPGKAMERVIARTSGAADQ
jgi:hypothetical protein